MAANFTSALRGGSSLVVVRQIHVVQLGALLAISDLLISRRTSTQDFQINYATTVFSTPVKPLVSWAAVEALIIATAIAALPQISQICISQTTRPRLLTFLA
jgi:hypothetical protein